MDDDPYAALIPSRAAPADDDPYAALIPKRARSTPGVGLTDPSLDATPFAATTPHDPGAGYSEDQSYTNDTARAFLQGVTSFGDEAIAGVKSILPTQDNFRAHLNAAKGGPSAYDQHLAYERGRLDDMKDYDPAAYTGMQIGGAALSLPAPAMMFNRLTQGIDGLGRVERIMRLAGAGAATGAASAAHHAAGDARPDEDASIPQAIGERLGNAVIPSETNSIMGLPPVAVGALAGGVLAPAMGMIGGNVINPTIRAVSDNLTPSRAASSMMLRRLEESGVSLDELSERLAVGAQSFNNPASRGRMLQLFGEELERTGVGTPQAVRQARDQAQQRFVQETGLSASTAQDRFRDVGRAQQESNLMLGEYPAIMEANRLQSHMQATSRMTDDRLRRSAVETSGIDDTAVHRMIENVGSGSNMPSASLVRNAVMDRAGEAKEDMRGFLWRLVTNATGAGQPQRPMIQALQANGRVPAPQEALEVADGMAQHAVQTARGAYSAAHNSAGMGPQQYAQLYRDVNSALGRIRGRANARAGDYADAMHNAAQEIEDLIQQTGGRYTLQQLQDQRASIRYMIRSAENRGDEAVTRVLQPFYDDLTRAMENANPVWGVANRRWAALEDEDEALLLGQMFARKQGVKQREQIEQFNDMPPEAQDMLRVGYLQHLEDRIANNGDTHDVAKLFDEPTRNMINRLFGRDAFLSLMAKLRDVKVSTMSRNMLANSRTAPRLNQTSIDDADIGVVASLQTANKDAAKSWITEMAISVIREWRNGSLARAITTPISDTTAVARQLQGLRRNHERRQGLAGPPVRARQTGGVAIPTVGSALSDTNDKDTRR